MKYLQLFLQIEENGDVYILNIMSTDSKDSGQVICMARYTCPNCITTLKPGEALCSCFQTAASCSAELIVSDIHRSDSEGDIKTCKSIRSQSLPPNEIDLNSQKKSNCPRNLPKENDICASKNSPAVIFRGPTDCDAFKGETVILRANYTGHPEPNVRWLKAVSSFTENFTSR